MKRIVSLNKIYNEDCFKTLERIPNKSVNIVLTSPPYNTSRPGVTDKYNSRYDTFSDSKTYQDYIDWTVSVFKGYERILAKNGTVLYNLSYSADKPDLMWLVVAEIIKQTGFTTADCIAWKKNSAIPNNVSSNKLTRICEYVFVFCKKTELQTFHCNKKIAGKMQRTGQPIFENLFNFVEAANNDGTTPLNKATFSTELCRKLLWMYGKQGFVVYDSFIGTGTTARACIETKMKFIGSEISKEQCEYANTLIKQTMRWQKF
jgi:DNA modification methylase